MCKLEVEIGSKKTPDMVSKPYLVFYEDGCGRRTRRRPERTGLWRGKHWECGRREIIRNFEL